LGLDLLCPRIFNGKIYIQNNAYYFLPSFSDLFCLFQSPALGFFYAGLARAKNALSLMYLTVMSVAVVSFQV
jgi:ammonia channel protein AmtB